MPEPYRINFLQKARITHPTFNTSTPGFKFADWEMKGIPLRLEFGPKDAAASVVTYARRDTGAKGTIPIAELATQVPTMLETIQQDMYSKAEECFRSHRLVLTEWEKVVPALDSRNVVLIPFCEAPACEERIKELTKSDEQHELGPDGLKLPSMGMKSLCIPFEQVRTCGTNKLFQVEIIADPYASQSSPTVLSRARRSV